MPFTLTNPQKCDKIDMFVRREVDFKMPKSSMNNMDRFLSRTKIYLVIIAVLLFVICLFDLKLIPLAVILFGLIVAYAVWSNSKRTSEVSRHIQDLTLNVDSAAKMTLINSPFPLVILEPNGSIIWRSSKFIKEFASIDINNFLDDIVKEIKQEIENKEQLETKGIIEKEIQIGVKTYEVLGEYSRNKEKNKEKIENIIILYFVDKTDYVNLKKDYEDSQSCIGIVMIDNYDEIMKSSSSELKTHLSAKIEEKIYNWVTTTGGVVIKGERDTFIYVFKQKYLEEIEEKKFEILDNIKELESETKVPVTLSIAISGEGETEYEKYKSAEAAIDIALGRGGDQAVVRKDGNYQFFGGRAQEVEKRTKVKARIIASALGELIQEASNVVIMGHTNGDSDSIGSALGLSRLVRTLEKDVSIVYTPNSSLENFINDLDKEEYKDVIISKDEAEEKTTEDTLLIIVDTHKSTYVEVPELLEKTKKIVLIDHHRRSTDFIENTILTFHEVYASSAAELVTEILQYSKVDIELEQIEAEALYAGIMVDTKNFAFKTGVRTFEAAAYLRKCGVDILNVKRWFQTNLKEYNLISEIVRQSEVVNESIGIAIYEEESANTMLVCAKAADELLTISDITASFVIGKVGNMAIISGRSIGDINVQVILEKLGGGGHITVAGTQLENVTIEEAKQELIIRINEYFTEIGG